MQREAVVHPAPVAPKTTWHALTKLVSLNVQKDISAPFMVPVYSDAITLPDYHAVIKEPSDLGTVSQKCKENAYKTYGEFAHAMRLIPANCLLYNDRQTMGSLCAMADRLSAMFETEWGEQVLGLYEAMQRKTMEEKWRRRELGWFLLSWEGCRC